MYSVNTKHGYCLLTMLWYVNLPHQQLSAHKQWAQLKWSSLKTICFQRCTAHSQMNAACLLRYNVIAALK